MFGLNKKENIDALVASLCFLIFQILILKNMSAKVIEKFEDFLQQNHQVLMRLGKSTAKVHNFHYNGKDKKVSAFDLVQSLFSIWKQEIVNGHANADVIRLKLTSIAKALDSSAFGTYSAMFIFKQVKDVKTGKDNGGQEEKGSPAIEADDEAFDG